MVVTTSGVLATVLLGIATLTKRKDEAFALPDSARLWVIVALALLTAALAGALMTNFPWKSDEADVAGLRKLVDQYWDDSLGEAERTITINRLGVLEDAKRVNGRRAWFLFAAMGCELLALVAIAVAVALSL
jgi:hypothetical protein